MDRNSFRRYFGDQRKLKRIVDFLIMNQKLTRPRWYVRMLMPLYQRRAWSATIYRSVRMDTPHTGSLPSAREVWWNRLLA